jgi:hypothetical protein
LTKNASVKRVLGGWCWTFRLWWQQYSREDIHQEIRLFFINEYLRFKNKLRYTNVLELLIIFVTEVAMVIVYNTDIGGNNLQKNIWSGTKSMANKKAQAITELMSKLRMQTNIGFSHPHIKGTENIMTGGFSCKVVKDFTNSFQSYSRPELKNLFKQEHLGS